MITQTKSRGAKAPETSTRRGAQWLASRIESYWDQHGRKARVWVEEVPGVAHFARTLPGEGYWIVKSDMVNRSAAGEDRMTDRFAADFIERGDYEND